jgi:hypothetical protein
MTGTDIARTALETPAQRKVDALEGVLKTLPQVDQPLKHHFAPGLYAREILNPKGSLIVTKMHKTCHLHVIVKGKISVWIEGAGVKTFTAPHVGITYPGTRRIIYAHEDTIFMTLHPNPKELHNLDELEKEIIYNEADESIIEPQIIHELKRAN